MINGDKRNTVKSLGNLTSDISISNLKKPKNDITAQNDSLNSRSVEVNTGRPDSGVESVDDTQKIGHLMGQQMQEDEDQGRLEEENHARDINKAGKHTRAH